jgi:hypothetical protein
MERLIERVCGLLPLLEVLPNRQNRARVGKEATHAT